MKEFFVEGRYFPDPIQAFTFAQIQADRMGRSVEIRLEGKTGPYHGTAHPPNFMRAHTVKQPPGLIASAA